MKLHTPIIEIQCLLRFYYTCFIYSFCCCVCYVYRIILKQILGLMSIILIWFGLHLRKNMDIFFHSHNAIIIPRKMNNNSLVPSMFKVPLLSQLFLVGLFESVAKQGKYCIWVFFKQKFIYLFLAVLGLRFCARAFSSCGEREPLFIAVHSPLTIAASLVAEHRLQTHRLSSCGSQTQLLHGMWDLPRPGLKPVSPALAGRLSTTAPPGKPCIWFLHLLRFF